MHKNVQCEITKKQGQVSQLRKITFFVKSGPCARPLCGGELCRTGGHAVDRHFHRMNILNLTEELHHILSAHPFHAQARDEAAAKGLVRQHGQADRDDLILRHVRFAQAENNKN